MGLFDLFKKKPAVHTRPPIQSENPEAFPPEVRLAQAAQFIRLMEDSVRLISTTLYCKTFFYRYDFALENAEKVLHLSKGLCNEKEAQDMVDVLQRERVNITNAFLYRCFEAGKIRFVEKDIVPYWDKVPQESREFLKDLLEYQRLTQESKQTAKETAVVAGLVGAQLISDLTKKKNTPAHRCNGDCDHCPPHYGYRYGRWYYGHGHQRGCQRGGNGGARGKTYRD